MAIRFTLLLVLLGCARYSSVLAGQPIYRPVEMSPYHAAENDSLRAVNDKRYLLYYINVFAGGGYNFYFMQNSRVFIPSTFEKQFTQTITYKNIQGQFTISTGADFAIYPHKIIGFAMGTHFVVTQTKCDYFYSYSPLFAAVGAVKGPITMRRYFLHVPITLSLKTPGPSCFFFNLGLLANIALKYTTGLSQYEENIPSNKHRRNYLRNSCVGAIAEAGGRISLHSKGALSISTAFTRLFYPYFLVSTSGTPVPHNQLNIVVLKLGYSFLYNTGSKKAG